MKKRKRDRRGGLQGDRRRRHSFHTRKTSGIRSYQDIWLENLSAEVSRACDRFWTLTPDRRAQEARRKASGFMQRDFIACKKIP